IWNQAAERIFGWTAQEVIGTTLPITADNTNADQCSLASERTLAKKRGNSMETSRCRRDGSVIDIYLSVAPLNDSQERFSGMMAIMEDITARKQAEQKISEQ